MASIKQRIIDIFKNKKVIAEVEPVEDIESLREELLHTVVDFKNLKANDFSQKMLAYQLSLLGIKKEYIGTFKNTYSKIAAFYDGKADTIMIGNSVYDSFFHLAELIDNISHESFHACPKQVVDDRKYKFDKNSRTLISDSKRAAKLIGVKNLSDTFYYTNLMEKQAFNYSLNFTQQFLLDAQKLAKRENKIFSYMLLKKALIHYQNSEVKPIQKKLAKSQEKFIQNIPEIYSKADNQLSKLIGLVKTYRDGERLSLRDFFTKIKLVKDVKLINKDNSFLRPFIAISEIFSVVPIRERVEDYLDFILSCEGTTEILTYMLLEERVPLTKADVTKIFVCSDYFKKDGCNYLEDYSLSFFDEETIVKNFLVSQGPKVMKEKFFGLFKEENNFLSKLDVDKIKSMIEQYPDKPIFLQGEQFEGASQVLHYTLDKLIDSGVILEDDFAITKVEIANNLVGIIQHFNYPTPDNLEYLIALNRFIENPFEQQFEVEEEINELSSAHDYVLSEKLAEYIASQRVTEQECMSLEN